MLTLRLTPTEEKALDQVTRLGRYRNRSAAVRAALSLLFDEHALKQEARDAIKRERGRVRSVRSVKGTL